MRLAKSFLGEILSSIEFVDQSSLKCVTTQLKLVSPIDNFPFYILFETSGMWFRRTVVALLSALFAHIYSTGCHPDHDAEKFDLFLEYLLKNGTIADGIIAADSVRINVINSVYLVF